MNAPKNINAGSSYVSEQGSDNLKTWSNDHHHIIKIVVLDVYYLNVLPPPPRLPLDRSVFCARASSLHRVQSSFASYKFQYLLFSLRSPRSILLLIPRLLVPSIIPSIMCFRSQTRSKMWQMWPEPFFIVLFAGCCYLPSLYATLPPHTVFLIYFSKCPSFLTHKCSNLLISSLNLSPIFW